VISIVQNVATNFIGNALHVTATDTSRAAIARLVVKRNQIQLVLVAMAREKLITCCDTVVKTIPLISLNINDGKRNEYNKRSRIPAMWLLDMSNISECLLKLLSIP
jgi:hypothetical protein